MTKYNFRISLNLNSKKIFQLIHFYKKMKELKERQRQQNKQKAIKLGLDPE